MTYNCLAEGTSKLLMLIPFSSTTDEEDDAIAEGDAEAAGDAGVAAVATDVTGVALSWMMVCGAKPRTGLTIQLGGDVTTPHTQYADAPTVVADGAGAGAWAVDLDWSAPHPSATAQPVDPSQVAEAAGIMTSALLLPREGYEDNPEEFRKVRMAGGHKPTSRSGCAAFDVGALLFGLQHAQ